MGSPGLRGVSKPVRVINSQKNRYMARLTITNGEEAGLMLELQVGRNTIGRAEDNDFCIPEPSISSHHCELQVSDFGIRFRDLGSTNGSYVDGVAVGEVDLRDAQVLRLGTVDFRVDVPPVTIAIPELPRPEEPPPAFTDDGEPACCQHVGVLAAYQCHQCHQTYCTDCVKRLRLAGGKARVFCPVCSGACMLIAAERAPTKASLSAKLLKTLRLPFWK